MLERKDRLNSYLRCQVYSNLARERAKLRLQLAVFRSTIKQQCYMNFIRTLKCGCSDEIHVLRLSVSYLYYGNLKVNRGLVVHLLCRGCPCLRGSIIGGFTALVILVCTPKIQCNYNCTQSVNKPTTLCIHCKESQLDLDVENTIRDGYLQVCVTSQFAAQNHASFVITTCCCYKPTITFNYFL